ncbi:MAG: LamG domain-containing protein [Pyrinomonadaceae bacterium]
MNSTRWAVAVILITGAALISLTGRSAFSQSACGVPAPAGLLHWWTADNTTADIINNLDGTLVNGGYAAGEVSSAFDLANDSTGAARFQVPADQSLDFNGDFTIDFWVNPGTTQNANADLLRKEDPVQQTANGFGIEMDGTANSNTYFAGWKNTAGAQCWTTAPFVLTPNQWQLVAVVFDQDTASTQFTRTVYVNGTPVSTCTGAAPIATNSAPLQFGDWTPQPFGNREWDGLVDEIEIFSRALTQAEIQTLVNAGSAGKVIPLSLDIKPGDGVNPINLGSRGKVPVAILSTAAFDASTVDVASITFAGAHVARRKNGTFMASLEDVNGDGLRDLVLHFNTQDLRGLNNSTTSITIMATVNGRCASGTDTVKIVPGGKVHSSKMDNDNDDSDR